MSPTAPAVEATEAGDGSTARPKLPELLLAAFITGLGVLCVYEATTIPTNAASRGPVGSGAMPTVVGILLTLAGLLIAVDVVRGNFGEREGGEDIDFDQKADWNALGLITLVFLANAVLIEHIGWPISGAVLFYGAAVALGSRRMFRDVLIAVVVSLASYYLFANGLGIPLPAGPLEGLL
jgi:putative tricarboxylic transport membrane protein